MQNIRSAAHALRPQHCAAGTSATSGVDADRSEVARSKRAGGLFRDVDAFMHRSLSQEHEHRYSACRVRKTQAPTTLEFDRSARHRFGR
jgi:hypothetical protein